jgi:serine/threonine protein kinase
MEQKQSCLRDFDVLCKLGEGAFGQVYKVKRKADSKEYALKKVRSLIILDSHWFDEVEREGKRTQRGSYFSLLQSRIHHWLQVVLL